MSYSKYDIVVTIPKEGRERDIFQAGWGLGHSHGLAEGRERFCKTLAIASALAVAFVVGWWL